MLHFFTPSVQATSGTYPASHHAACSADAIWRWPETFVSVDFKSYTCTFIAPASLMSWCLLYGLKAKVNLNVIYIYIYIYIYIQSVYTNQLMMCGEIIAVCIQMHPKHTRVSTLCGQNVEFLGAFAKLRKVTVNVVIPVRLSVRSSMRTEQFASRCTDFREIWYLSVFRKSFKKIQVSFKIWQE
jgi:hypothetical protein